MSVANWISNDAYEDEPIQGREVRWHPRSVEGQDFPDVPDHIADAASEAYRCHSIGAYRGAIALSRAVLEAAAKANGAEERDLYTMIDGLRTRELIREHVKEAAHEIRHLGNDVAHGDFVEPFTEEESSEVLGLVDELLHELFQSPAQVARRRASRLAKKKAQ